jgi:hypothetical protein
MASEAEQRRLDRRQRATASPTVQFLQSDVDKRALVCMELDRCIRALDDRQYEMEKTIFFSVLGIMAAKELYLMNENYEKISILTDVLMTIKEAIGPICASTLAIISDCPSKKDDILSKSDTDEEDEEEDIVYTCAQKGEEEKEDKVEEQPAGAFNPGDYDFDEEQK